MLAQAVAAGAGAALLPSFLIAQELASGTLIAPLPLPMDEDRSYYLAWPETQPPSPSFAAFRAWMLDEAAAETSPPMP